MSFEVNQGQTDLQVKFLARGRGYTLFLAPTEAVLALREATAKPPQKADRVRTTLEPETAPAHTPTVLRMKLVGSNPAPRVVGLDELPGKSNYFIGNDPENWRTNVSNYSRVLYENVYEGVDLIYYGRQGQLEYDFVVAPGAVPGVIELGFEGAEGIEIDRQGNLVLSIRGGEVSLHKPVVYQEVDGVRQEIQGGYALRERNRVGFQVAAYDVGKPLVIDPTLAYSTYLGGNGDDSGVAIAVDGSGNAYVTGFTNSTNFPTASPFQATTGGGQDAFVTKFNATGSALVYSTHLGGSGGEVGNGIAVDTSGNAYVTGQTTSTNFPTASPLQATLGGSVDAFVTKFNAAGSALVYSTYLGGSADDRGFAIAVDASGNAYVTGETFSANFPTASPLQAMLGSSNFDAFVTKFNAAGSALVYSTYLGGSGNERGFGIAVDTGGSAYVTGLTDSTNFPTASPLQAALGGFVDAFVTKFNAAGSALVYSTYLGGSLGGGAGSAHDFGTAIAVDTSGNAYVTGLTASTNFPTASPIQATLGGGDDAFVTQFNPTGSALVYSTYLGGSSGDQGNGIAADTSGNAYVTGQTSSTNFPTVSPFQATNAGGLDCLCDAFVTKISPAAADLAVTKTDSPDPVTAGVDLTYTVTVTNNGPDAATGVALSDTLPVGVALVSSTPSQGSCTGTFPVTCDLGTLANAATATVTIVVRPATPGTITNSASVTSNVFDPDPANNTAAADTTVNDFGITANPTQGTVTAGQSFMTTITATAMTAPVAQMVTYGCTGLPFGASCSFNPPMASSIPLDPGTPTMLTIGTSAPSTATLEAPSGNHSPVPFYALWLLVPGAAGFGLVFAGGRGSKHRRGGLLCLLAVLLVMSGLLGACGNSKEMMPTTMAGTPTGTHSITVTATVGSVQRTVQVMVTVR